MSVIVNGTEYSKVYHDGVQYTKLYYNGVNYLAQAGLGFGTNGKNLVPTTFVPLAATNNFSIADPENTTIGFKSLGSKTIVSYTANGLGAYSNMRAIQNGVVSIDFYLMEPNSGSVTFKFSDGTSQTIMLDTSSGNTAVITIVK